jgi:hypothetical protein
MGTIDIIIGKVTAVHVADGALMDGLLIVAKTQSIARCGYYKYAVIGETFDMIIPNMSQDVLYKFKGDVARNRQRNIESREDGFAQK